MTSTKHIYMRGIPYLLSANGKFYEMDTTSEEYKKYKAGHDHQLEQWLLGNPVHNNWHANHDYTECCPDFSCCGGDLWSEEMRKQFAAAEIEERSLMAMYTLGVTMHKTLPTSSVYLSGNAPITKH